LELGSFEFDDISVTRFACLAAIAAFLLNGCDFMSEEIGRFLRGGPKTTTVILAPNPLRLSSVPTRLEVGKPLEVVGTISAVCLSLRGDLPLVSAEAMSAEFTSQIQGASVTAFITTTSGKKLPLSKPYQSWSKEGKIARTNELAACMRGNSNELPAGTTVSSVEVSSSAPLDIGGVYWVSTNAWDKPSLP
jgi:hypothetical protein